MKRGIAPKNAEVVSLQATINFLVKFTKTFISDLSSQFVSRPQNYIVWEALLLRQSDFKTAHLQYSLWSQVNIAIPQSHIIRWLGWTCFNFYLKIPKNLNNILRRVLICMALGNHHPWPNTFFHFCVPPNICESIPLSSLAFQDLQQSKVDNMLLWEIGLTDPIQIRL